MQYIWCEDTRSGYFFWQQINKVFFHNKYIVKCSKGISELEKAISNVIDDGNKYLVCFDNCTDNEKLLGSIRIIRKAARKSKNIKLVKYICFEQVLLSSPEITKFIPKISNDQRLKIIQQHLLKDYTDVNALIALCKHGGIPKNQYSTTERFFRPIIEDNAVIQSTNIPLPNGRRFDKKVMCHHYIYKGSWSQCWYKDCLPNCPDDFCWKTEHECKTCNDFKINYTCMKSGTFNNVKRKYEEESVCNREATGLPDKQSERIRLLFENSILKYLFE